MAGQRGKPRAESQVPLPTDSGVYSEGGLDSLYHAFRSKSFEEALYGMEHEALQLSE